MEIFPLILFIIIQYFNKINAEKNDDEIVKIPGANFPLNFKQYSGFFQVSATHFYHYWFLESKNVPKTDPLIISLSSGPGCSSMQSVLFPFYTNSDGKTLRPNPYGLNKNASVLVIDGPAGVGFSYTTDGDYKSDDDLTAAEYYEALKKFFIKYPSFRNHSVFVEGASYGGVYAPLFAVKILAGQNDYPVDIKGIIIGNGVLASINSITSMVEYGYYHGLVDEKWWTMIQRECCDGGTADYKCWDGIMENEWKVLADNETCGLKIWNVYQELWDSGVDAYDISLICKNDTKVGETDSAEMTKFVPTKILIRFLHHLNQNRNKTIKNDAPINGKNISIKNILPKILPTLTNNSFIPVDQCNSGKYKTTYLNREEVQKALHIPSTNGAYSFKPTKGSTAVWESCWNNEIDYGFIHTDMASEIKAILDAKLRVLLYYGDQDMYVNFLHGQRMPERIGLEITTAKKPWKFGNVIAGFNTTYANGALTMLTVRLAGHSVMASRPDLTDYIINKFLQE